MKRRDDEHNISRLNDLYLKVLNINRGMLAGKSSKFLARNCQDPEVRVFFGALDVALIVMIDRVRGIKLEIFDNIPAMQREFFKNPEVRERLSEIIYEYIFSGLAICFLDSIMKNHCGFHRPRATMTADLLWDIFSRRAGEFRLPDLNDFMGAEANGEVSSMFRLMFDSMYERMRIQVPALGGLSVGISAIVKEVVERSIIEGMMIFRSYEEAILEITDMRINA